MAALASTLIPMVGNLFSGLLGGNAASKAGRIIQQAGNQAATNVQTAANTGQQGAAQMVSNAAQLIPQQSTAANQLLTDLYNKGMASNVPYTQAGSDASAALANYSKNLTPFSFNPTDLQNDPGYQFKLQQGTQGLQNSAAAKGLLSSGNTLTSLDQFNQGLAGTTFNNAFNRALQTYNTNVGTTLQTLLPQIQAGQTATGQGLQLGEFTGQQMGANLINPAEYLSNLGLQGAEYSGNLGLQGATTAGNFAMQAAQGAAGGTLGQANAYTGALGGLFNSAASLPGALANPYGYSVGSAPIPGVPDMGIVPPGGYSNYSSAPPTVNYSPPMM